PGGRRAGPGGRAGRRQLRVAVDGPERRRPGPVRPRQLAAPPARPHAGRSPQTQGAVGAAARALLRHARLPGAERQPAAGAGVLPTRMSKSFLKRSLRGFEPYVPGQQPPDGDGWVKLNTNEAPWPPSPRVLAAVRAAVDGSLRLYPSPNWGSAREAIARHHGVAADQVALGNGGDELIAMAFRAFAGAGDRVAYPTPTYSLLEPLGRIHECQPAPHPMTTDWELPDSFTADPAPL